MFSPCKVLLTRLGERLAGLPRSCVRRMHIVNGGWTEVGIVGVPMKKGQPRPGVEWGPKKIRDAGLIQKLENMGCSVSDAGDLKFETVPNDLPCHNIKFPRTLGLAMKQISDSVASTVGSGKTCVALGGDHSMAIGTLYGHAQVEPNMKVVWIDAHSDINPPLASISGNIHGMVLSFLMKELAGLVPEVEGLEWIKPCLTAKDIAFIALRDIDPAERYIIERLGITCYAMHDIDEHGIDNVIERTIETINPGLKLPMHVSFDIDSLDPEFAPSTGTPVPGGLTLREGMYLAEELGLTDRVTSIDLVEVNPYLGTAKEQDLTASSAVDIITAFFGKRRTDNLPDDYRLPVPPGSNATGTLP